MMMLMKMVMKKIMMMLIKTMMLILTFQSGRKLGPASCYHQDNENIGDDDGEEVDDNEDDDEEVDDDVNPRIPMMGENGHCFLSKSG